MTSSPSPALTESPAASAETPSPAPVAPPPSLAELFVAFATISLYGFGGVLAWSRRMMVEERRWLSSEQFNEAYALCAFLSLVFVAKWVRETKGVALEDMHAELMAT